MNKPTRINTNIRWLRKLYQWHPNRRRKINAADHSYHIHSGDHNDEISLRMPVQQEAEDYPSADGAEPGTIEYGLRRYPFWPGR